MTNVSTGTVSVLLEMFAEEVRQETKLLGVHTDSVVVYPARIDMNGIASSSTSVESNSIASPVSPPRDVRQPDDQSGSAVGAEPAVVKPVQLVGHDGSAIFRMKYPVDPRVQFPGAVFECIASSDFPELQGMLPSVLEARNRLTADGADNHLFQEQSRLKKIIFPIAFTLANQSAANIKQYK